MHSIWHSQVCMGNSGGSGSQVFLSPHKSRNRFCINIIQLAGQDTCICKQISCEHNFPFSPVLSSGPTADTGAKKLPHFPPFLHPRPTFRQLQFLGLLAHIVLPFAFGWSSATLSCAFPATPAAKLSEKLCLSLRQAATGTWLRSIVRYRIYQVLYLVAYNYLKEKLPYTVFKL